jgi:hypothetical protein
MNDDEPPRSDLEQLKAEHRELDARIAAMTQSGMLDQVELARLKKRKLMLKDQIALLIDLSIPDIIA